MPRPIAKRAATIAMLNAIGGTSNIWASYLYYAPPRFFAAFGCREYSLTIWTERSKLTEQSLRALSFLPPS
ncbi:MAG: hypothetical protein EOO38_08625 [Cytophagaceae bacterium]|nr:MAG: hypothetical protein EOO38_08625 [Cytophagaceae bacterium]